jgi:phytanoyl-CoA hydroxylase
MDALPRFSAPADGVLSVDMLGAFDEAGVILLEDFVGPEGCIELQQRAEALVAGFSAADRPSIFSTTDDAHTRDDYFLDSGDKIRCFFEEGALDRDGKLRRPGLDSLNKIGHALHDLDPTFERFSRAPRLAAAVRSLGIRNPAIIQSMYICKPAGIGGEVGMHQDSTYLYTEPESCIGFWFALEDATRENGCMYFLPGAHHGPLRARQVRHADGTLETKQLDDTPWPAVAPLPAEASQGTLVIFHGRAPHCSGANRSASSRHAYTLHVIDRDCRYLSDNWLQRAPGLPLRGFD